MTGYAMIQRTLGYIAWRVRAAWRRPNIRYTTLVLIVLTLLMLLVRSHRPYLMFTSEYEPADRESYRNNYETYYVERQADAELVLDAAHLPTSEYTLVGQVGARDAVLKVRNACMNRDYGVFFLASPSTTPPTLPLASMLATTDMFDIYYAPRVITTDTLDALQQNYARNDIQPRIVRLTNTTLFHHYPFQGYHYSHFMVNTELPLLDLLTWHYAPQGDTAARLDYSRSLGWLSESRHYYLMHPVPEVGYGDALPWLAVPSIGRSDPLQAFNFQHIFRNSLDSLPAGTTVCYDNTVIGLNSTCVVGGCAHLPSTDELDIYTAFRNLMRHHYLTSDQRRSLADWEKQERRPAERNVVVVQRHGTRSFLNLPEIQALLERLSLNYRVVGLEGSTISEQIELFSRTDVLIAMHGNALGNMFWMPRDAVIVEMWAYGWESAWFQRISEHLSINSPLHHHVVQCREPSCASPDERSPSFNAKHRSGAINIAELERLLLKYGLDNRPSTSA